MAARTANTTLRMKAQVRKLGTRDAWKDLCTTPGPISVRDKHELALTPLDQDHFTDTELEKLGRDFAGFPSLTWLYLTGTPVTDAGVSHLAELTSLTVIWLRNTRVSEAGRAALQAKLPRCEIF